MVPRKFRDRGSLRAEVATSAGGAYVTVCCTLSMLGHSFLSYNMLPSPALIVRGTW